MATLVVKWNDGYVFMMETDDAIKNNSAQDREQPSGPCAKKQEGKAKIRSLYTTAIKHCQGDKTFLFSLVAPPKRSIHLFLRSRVDESRARWKWNKMQKKSKEPKLEWKDVHKNSSAVEQKC